MPELSLRERERELKAAAWQELFRVCVSSTSSSGGLTCVARPLFRAESDAFNHSGKLAPATHDAVDIAESDSQILRT